MSSCTNNATDISIDDAECCCRRGELLGYNIWPSKTLTELTKKGTHRQTLSFDPIPKKLAEHLNYFVLNTKLYSYSISDVWLVNCNFHFVNVLYTQIQYTISIYICIWNCHVLEYLVKEYILVQDGDASVHLTLSLKPPLLTSFPHLSLINTIIIIVVVSSSFAQLYFPWTNGERCNRDLHYGS